MQRSLLASLIIVSLSACDGTTGVVAPEDNLTDNITGSETPTLGNDGVSTPTDASGDNGSNASTDTSDNTDVNTDSGTDTSGSVASDAGGASGNTGTSTTGTESQTSENDSDKYDDSDASGSSDDDKSDDKPATDNNDNTGNAGNGGIVSDDAGSSTSEGSQTTTDSGSNNSDPGNTDTDASGNTEVNDDSGSSTSDGGQIADDAASGTSDGGQSSNDSTGNDTTADNSSSTGDRNTNAGAFESDNTGGSVLRRSTLSSSGQQNICTTASNQNNFSDTRVGDFILHNNAWRPWRAFPGYEWEQCIHTNTNDSLVGWNYDWGPGQTGINGSPSASGDFYVRSYPELIYGVKDEFRTSAPQSVTGLPIKLSALPNITIDYSYDGPQFGESRTVDASNNARFQNGSTISGERNVAVETFMYNADSAGNCSEGIVTRNGGSNHTYEVMVWLDAGAERLPAGPSDFVADLNIRGDAYKVYTKASDPRYIAFVAQNPQTTGTIFWNDYIDWARENAHQVQQRFGARSNSVQIQDDWCVANIIVGTEIFWGAGNIDIYDWTITQSQ